jgi:acetone monooxygenase
MGEGQPQKAPEQVDAVVVGAGLNGIYQLYSLVERGLTVRTFEAGEGVGGVWYWNRYPGARCDSHFPFYQYWFSKALWDEADWKERFPGQADIEAYLNRVCDKFDLKRHITFGALVTEARFDEETGRWLVTTDRGDRVSAQFLVLSTGGLSVAAKPPFEGADRFKGLSCHTSRWPREGVDMKGKRVGVVGTAATGIQVIQTIAPEVERLVVFQRTPNYAISMRNDRIGPEDLAKMRADYPELLAGVRQSEGGFVYGGPPPPNFADLTPAERTAHLERIWAEGNLRLWGGSFADAGDNPEASEFVSDFVRGKIREKVKDPAVAEKLIPRDHAFASRRVPLENGYFEAFNRDNVELVDLREDPIVSIDETGVNTASGRHHDLDVIVYATGFEAGVGAIRRIDIRGRGGVSLREQWDKAVTTTVGMQVHGFPNLFMTMAPFAPASALCNIPVCSDQQVQWITDTIAFVRDQGLRSIEPKAETEAAWMAHHQEVSEPTLIGRNRKSWYRLPTGNRELIAYLGGLNQYRATCEGYRASGYAGFALT